MTANELAILVRGIAPVLRTQIAAAVEKAIGGMADRLLSLEQRVAAIRDGADGKDGASGPQGERGEKGDKGDPGDRGEQGPMGPAGPVGERGEKGLDGRDGLDGKDGAPGPQGERGLAGERGEKGLDGPEGKPGRDGRDGLPGPMGEKGLDGTNGKDGRDGIDGKDGLGFDDIVVEHDGERGFAFKFVRGEQVKTFGAFSVPALIYRGVYEAGRTYERGDTVTWGGSMWHASETTTAKPGEAALVSRAWQLCVKKGTDGKQGPQGPQGPQGLRGEKGEDGRVYR